VLDALSLICDVADFRLDFFIAALMPRLMPDYYAFRRRRCMTIMMAEPRTALFYPAPAASVLAYS